MGWRAFCGKMVCVIFRLAIATAILLCGTVSAETNSVIRSAAELARVVARKGTAGRPFQFRATVISRPAVLRHSFGVMDESGGVPVVDIREKNDPAVSPGDTVLIDGLTEPRRKDIPGDGSVNANCTNIVILAHGAPPPSTHITAAGMERDDLLFTPVDIDGILVDVRLDEIDPQYILFVLDCSNRMAYAAAHVAAFKQPLQDAKRLVGATVRIDGTLSQHTGHRALSRRLVSMHDHNEIRVLTPPSDALFQVSGIGPVDGRSPEAIIALGRRKAVGRVLAVWNGDTLLMQTTSGEPMKVDLVTSPPAVGDVIEAVGYVETDLFHVNLARAIWRPSRMTVADERPVREIEARELFADKHGDRLFNAEFHGRTVCLRGIVRDIPSASGGGRLILDSGGYMVAVDCSAAPGTVNELCVGCTVAATGVCVLETENWNKQATLPRTTGLFLAVRAPSDIQVVALPPWWTPAKLTAVIGALVLLIVAILVWNFSLRTLSERRGRELFRNQIARAESELRVDERTRLAAELHDHLAQNLTAISYQIAAVERSRDVEPDAAARHLSTAQRMLGSCRTELRRCLWDLRSDALDEPDFAAAIRKSVEPVAADAHVAVEWHVPRTKISDTTVHAILSIVRELASNAIRHGHARNVRVAGGLADGVLRFSVSDDGCGFDPATAADSADGHFGLDGIRERLRRHDGKMEIASAPGKGTTVDIRLVRHEAAKTKPVHESPTS